MLFAHSGRVSSGLVRQLSMHPSPPPPGSGPDPGEAGGGQAAPEGQAHGGGHRDQLLVAAMKHVKTLVCPMSCLSLRVVADAGASGLDRRRPSRCGFRPGTLSRVSGYVATWQHRHPRCLLMTHIPCPAGLLPRGAAELVEHFNIQCDAEFVARLQASQGDFDGA